MKKEFNIIANLIETNSKVLDVGCGDGELMDYIYNNITKDIRGIEISKKNVQKCIEKGLTVIEGDAEKDLKQFDGNLSNAFKNTKAKFFVISFTSDWLYPTQENKDIVIALNDIGADVGFVEIESDKGHDSFLLDVPDFLRTLKNFLNTSYGKINEKRI